MVACGADSHNCQDCWGVWMIAPYTIFISIVFGSYDSIPYRSLSAKIISIVYLATLKKTNVYKLSLVLQVFTGNNNANLEKNVNVFLR